MSNDAINQALRAASRPGRFEINSPIPAENREFNYQIRERLGKPSGRPEPPPAAEPTDVPDPGGEPVALTTTADWGGGPRGIPPGPARPSINDGIQEAFRRLRSGDGGRSADLAVVMDDMPRGRW